MSFIVKQKMQNGSIHVHVATSIRLKGKKSPTQNRKYLGVLDTRNNELLLGKSISCLTEEERKLVEAKGIVFNGKHLEHPERKQFLRKEEVVTAAVSCGRVFEYGRPLLLMGLAEDLGLAKALSDAFGEAEAKAVLAAAIFENCTGDALCRLAEWAEDTVLNDNITALSPSSITRLCENIGKNDQGQQSLFFRRWFKACGMPRSLISDTTSISSYSEKLTYLEWGHNRDLESLRQINLNMVFARDNGLPLFIRLIYGSVTDVATIVTTANIIGALGLHHYSFSLDRGFFSNENLWYFHDQKIDFTIGVPLGNRKGVVGKTLDSCRNKLHAFNSVIAFDDTVLNHAVAEYNLVRVNPQTKVPESFKAMAHVYLNQARRATEERELQEMLQGVLDEFVKCAFETLDSAKEWLQAKVGKNGSRLFTLVEAPSTKGRPPKKKSLSTDGRFRLSVNEVEYALEVRDFGIFMILNSDLDADGEQTLKDNRSRDLQEKVFDMLKNSTGNDRLKVSEDDTLDGRLLIAFVAVILRKAVENRLRAVGMLKDTSVNKALDLARKFNVMYVDDGHRIALEVPKKSRIIFETIVPGLLKKNGVNPGNISRSSKSTK